MGQHRNIRVNKIHNLHVLNHPSWKSFFRNNEYTTIAQNYCIGLILEKSFGYTYEAYEVIENEKLIGFIPFTQIGNKYVSIPHFSYGALFVKSIKKDSNFFKQILDQLNFKEFEIRGFDIQSPFYSNKKVSSFLKLEKTPDEQLKAFKSKLRSQIKKGYKNGLTSVYGGKELLEDFYFVYSHNMHDLGSPVLSKYFFQNILDYYENGSAKIHIVYFNEKPIGAGFVISFIKDIEVCWASTRKKFNYLQPNMVLYWEMISKAIQNNMERFSFGRSTKFSGTHRFKKQWGCEDIQLYFNHSKPQKTNIKNYTFLTKLWRVLPYKLTLLLGPWIAKKIY